MNVTVDIIKSIGKKEGFFLANMEDAIMNITDYRKYEPIWGKWFLLNVMYKLLNNNMEPFRTEHTHFDEENVLVLRMNGEKLSAPANANGRLAEIILKACRYEPKDRYESPLQLREELESILNEDISSLTLPFNPQNINNEYFDWNPSIMNIDDLECLSLSYGNYPIITTEEIAKQFHHTVTSSRSGRYTHRLLVQ